MKQTDRVGSEAGIHTVPARPKSVKSRPARAPRRTRRTTWRLGALAGLGGALAVMGLWFAINSVPWVGPWMADTARSILGTDAVARIEEWAYALDDRWNRWWRSGEKPAAHWSTELPPAPPVPPMDPSVGAGDNAARATELVAFAPGDVGPLFAEVAAPGDGVWVPVPDPMHPSETAVLAKTLIHPDRERPWSELFVMAVDVRQTRTFVAAGTIEPKASTQEGEAFVRRGVVPDDARDALVAVFNGGFKAEHGHYGMKVDGVTLLPPRPQACTIAGFSDGALRIATFTTLAPSEKETTWWRQTPSCMVENGKLHPGLANENATHWGYAVGGETVVRRSAVGLNEERTTLYVGVSNATHARAIAIGMRHAGASDVAQLDINWSYPHVVMFRPAKDGSPQGFLLFEGFAYEDNTYVTRRSQRDFFYIARARVPASEPSKAGSPRE